MVAYTLSKAEDSISDSSTPPQDQGRGRDPQNRRTALASIPHATRPIVADQRHRFTATACLPPFDSRHPASSLPGPGALQLIAGVDLNGDGDRPWSRRGSCAYGLHRPSTSLGRNTRAAAARAQARCARHQASETGARSTITSRRRAERFTGPTTTSTASSEPAPTHRAAADIRLHPFLPPRPLQSARVLLLILYYPRTLPTPRTIRPLFLSDHRGRVSSAPRAVTRSD